MGLQAIFLIIIVLLIAIFDVVIITTKGKKSSISAWAIRISYKYPSIVFLVAFGLGFTFGHLMWRMKTLDIYECKDREVQEIINYCNKEVVNDIYKMQ